MQRGCVGCCSTTRSATAHTAAGTLSLRGRMPMRLLGRVTKYVWHENHVMGWDVATVCWPCLLDQLIWAGQLSHCVLPCSKTVLVVACFKRSKPAISAVRCVFSADGGILHISGSAPCSLQASPSLWNGWCLYESHDGFLGAGMYCSAGI